jgi:hypothetical protein
LTWKTVVWILLKTTVKKLSKLLSFYNNFFSNVECIILYQPVKYLLFLHEYILFNINFRIYVLKVISCSIKLFCNKRDCTLQFPLITTSLAVSTGQFVLCDSLNYMTRNAFVYLWQRRCDSGKYLHPLWSVHTEWAMEIATRQFISLFRVFVACKVMLIVRIHASFSCFIEWIGPIFTKPGRKRLPIDDTPASYFEVNVIGNYGGESNFIKRLILPPLNV